MCMSGVFQDVNVYQNIKKSEVKQSSLKKIENKKKLVALLDCMGHPCAGAMLIFSVLFRLD